MGCGPKSMRISGSAHTTGSSETEVFSAFTDAISVADYESVKMSMEVEDLSDAAVQVARAVSYSNDGVTWDAPTALGSFTSTEGWDYGSAYATLSASKRFARLGILAKQPSGTDNENARVNLLIDLKPR